MSPSPSRTATRARYSPGVVYVKGSSWSVDHAVHGATGGCVVAVPRKSQLTWRFELNVSPLSVELLASKNTLCPARITAGDRLSRATGGLRGGSTISIPFALPDTLPAVAVRTRPVPTGVPIRIAPVQTPAMKGAVTSAAVQATLHSS